MTDRHSAFGSRRPTAWKRLTDRLTRWLQGEAPRQARLQAGDASVRRVLVLRTDQRLGNQLLTTPVIREIHRLFPQARIDVLGRGGQVELIHRGFSFVDRALGFPRRPLKAPGETIRVWRRFRERQYDLAFCAAASSSSSRVLMRICRARHKLWNFPLERLPDPAEAIHKAGQKVVSLRLQLVGLPDGKGIPALSMPLSETELESGRRSLRGYAGGQGRVLCLYTYATGERRFEADWWAGLQARLAERLPDWETVEALPVDNVSAFGFRLPAYYSRSIRELGAFLAACDLFVTGDCGIMHLASAVGTPTVGLFRASPVAKYAPYNPGSLGIDTRERSVESVAEAVVRHAEGLRRGGGG